MSRFKPSEELSPIKREAPRDWYICFTQFNGKPGRCGPYSQEQAEHRMRSTHWRPGSAPRYERGK